MNKRCAVLVYLFLATASRSVFAGDSVYGKVVAVKSADVVIFHHGTGTYVVHIVGMVPPPPGIFPPPLGNLSKKATLFLESLVMRKGEGIRMRLEYRIGAGEMVARLLTDDTDLGVQDVGLLLVSRGWAKRQPGFDYGFGELAKAESLAKEAKLNIWAIP
jgi:endonuclease YncB( thermonuclease family)